MEMAIWCSLPRKIQQLYRKPWRSCGIRNFFISASFFLSTLVIAESTVFWRSPKLGKSIPKKPLQHLLEIFFFFFHGSLLHTLLSKVSAGQLGLTQWPNNVGWVRGLGCIFSTFFIDGSGSGWTWILYPFGVNPNWIQPMLSLLLTAFNSCFPMNLAWTCQTFPKIQAMQMLGQSEKTCDLGHTMQIPL